MTREIPFHMRPLWTAAAASSQQDVLEASHCAALTASLRQLAGVMQHAGTAFEQLHEQTGKLTSRCQQAEARCLAVQSKLAYSMTSQYIGAQATGTASYVTGTTKRGLDSTPVLPTSANANTSSIHAPDASSDALIKAEYPTDVRLSATVHEMQPSLHADSTQLTATQPAPPAGPASSLNEEFSFRAQHKQSTGIPGGLSASEVSRSVQSSGVSQPILTGTEAGTSDAAAAEARAHARSAESAVTVPALIPVVNTELSDQPLLTQSVLEATTSQQAVGTELETTDAGSPVGAKAATLQQEDSSASGFHTPSSQPVSRIQSATSSDAFFDTASRLSSQTAASSTSSAGNSNAMSSLNSFASGRRPGPSTRQSTRDLIGALRQQAGLPPPDAFLSPPDDQEKTVVLSNAEQNTTRHGVNVDPLTVAGALAEQQPDALVQHLPVATANVASGTSASVVQPLVGQMSPGSVQARQHVLLQPEPSGVSGTSLQAEQVQPSLKLLELVSNPLYAKSLDASRAASPPVTDRSHLLYSSVEAQPTDATQAQAQLPSSTTDEQHRLLESTVDTSIAAAGTASGSEQSASLQAAIAEGSVMQESSQPILSGPEVAVTDDVLPSEPPPSVEQHSLSSGTDLAMAGSAANESGQDTTLEAAIAEGSIVQESSQPILLSAEASATDASTMAEAQPASVASEVSASDVTLSDAAKVDADGVPQPEELAAPVPEGANPRSLAEAAVSEAAFAEAAPLEPAGSIAQMSDEPILMSAQPAEASATSPVVVSNTTVLLGSQRTESQQTSFAETPAIEAVIDTAEVAAMSEEPILDPAADDVTTVSFPSEATVANESAWAGTSTQAEHTASTSWHTASIQQTSTAESAHSTRLDSENVLTEQPRLTVAAEPTQAHAQTVITEQPAMTAVLQRPPVPALPSKVRRSRSDLPAGQQPSSGLLMTQQSFAQMSNQAAMRSSISNITTAPAQQSALPQAVAYSTSIPQAADQRQTASPVKAASALPAIPAIPLAPPMPAPVQPVAPAVVQTAVVQTALPQQPLSAAEVPRDVPLQSAAPPGPVFMRSFGSFKPPQLAQQTAVVYSTTASTPQQLAPYPAPLGSPPAQPPRFMRTGAVPASASFQPMTAAVTVDTQGPLSKGVQESWNSIPASVLQQQQQPQLTVPPTASTWHQGTLNAQPVNSSSQHYMPLSVSYDSLQMPALQRVATPSIKPRTMQPPVMPSMQQAPVYDMQPAVMRSMQQYNTQPAAYAMQPQPSAASTAYAVNQATLRQSAPMMQPAQTVTASVPYSVGPGTVVQPMSSTVIVGQPNQETQRLAQSGAGFSIVPLQQAAQQQSLQQQIAARPALNRSQTGGMHASRALQAFSRSRSSITSIDIPADDSRLMQQRVSSSEPQPAERAESPPTPVAPPASYFHSRDRMPSMSTSHITVSAAPPLPPAPAPVLTVVQSPGQPLYGGSAPARTSRAPAFPAYLRPAVASLQAQAPQQVPYQAAQAYAAPQQAPPSISSQGSGQRHFQFQPAGQGLSPQSTPSVSVRSVPKFLEEAWAKGTSARESPPPLPGSFVANMQGGPRHSMAANAMAGWASTDQPGHQRTGTTIINDGQSSGQTTRDMMQPGLATEVSLYQSPMSLQSVSSYAGATPSPQPAAQATPKQATPATPAAPQTATAGAPDLLQSIRNGQYHLRKMSFSYQPKGMTQGNNGGQGTAETPLAALTAGSSGLPPAGGNRSRRRNSGSTTGMEAIMKRTQAIRQSVHPESTHADSDSDWDE